jgi:hypothetical protein
MVYVDDVELSPHPSYMIYNHAPDFEWGYGGQGPSQLALAILLDCTGNATLSIRLHQPFKRDFIENAEFDGFIIMESMIVKWLARQMPEGE